MRRRLTAVLWVLVILTACLSGCKREKESSGIEEISLEETDEEDVSDGADEEPEKEEDVICVYVCGQVASPGVYELPAGARVYQAIESAGGTLDGAAPESLNLAQLAEDGQKVYVPSREEAAAVPGETASPSPEQGGTDDSHRHRTDPGGGHYHLPGGRGRFPGAGGHHERGRHQGRHLREAER